MRRSPRYLELLEALAPLQVRSLTLPKLIELKELTNRDKDRAMLRVLRRTLELREEG